MTGTDLCVNKPQSVPVIFEPPCIKSLIFAFSFVCDVPYMVRSVQQK